MTPLGRRRTAGHAAGRAVRRGHGELHVPHRLAGRRHARLGGRPGQGPADGAGRDPDRRRQHARRRRPVPTRWPSAPSPPRSSPPLGAMFVVRIPPHGRLIRAATPARGGASGSSLIAPGIAGIVALAAGADSVHESTPAVTTTAPTRISTSTAAPPPPPSTSNPVTTATIATTSTSMSTTTTAPTTTTTTTIAPIVTHDARVGVGVLTPAAEADAPVRVEVPSIGADRPGAAGRRRRRRRAGDPRRRQGARVVEVRTDARGRRVGGDRRAPRLEARARRVQPPRRHPARRRRSR